MSVRADEVVLLTFDPARGELVPVDAGGDGHAGPDAAGQGDAGLEPAAVVVDLGPLAVGQAARSGVLGGELDGRLAGRRRDGGR